MAGRRDDEEGGVSPDSMPGDDRGSAVDTAEQGEKAVDDDVTVTDGVTGVTEPVEGEATPSGAKPSATGQVATPRKPQATGKASSPRKPSTPRKPSQRTAAERSAAAKKAAATRAANARARAEAAAKAAEEEVVAELADAGATTDGTLVVAVSADDYFGDAAVAEDADQADAPLDAAAPGALETTDEGLDERSDETAQDASAPDAAEPTVRPTGATREVDPEAPVVLAISGLMKRYGGTVAVENVDLEVRAGSFYGIVGPNGAGKTTTLSIVTGLLRPDAGTVTVLGADVWRDPAAAKRSLGVLPDRLRLFDRLTGAQLLYYSATLRGLDGVTARKRSSDLATAFGLHDALGRLVSDYSVGMTKKIALAAAIIHSPRVLVLDEPFESVDPVSAATVTDVLQRYVAGGGTVLLSSHSMDLVERICDSVAVIVDGHVLASGTVDEVRAGRSLEQRFVELAGGRAVTEGMDWLQNFSD